MIFLYYVLLVSGGVLASHQPSENLTTQGRSVGPERCLSSDSPFWCLAEETSAGLAGVLSTPLDTSSAKASTDTFAMIGDLAASTFDLGLSSDLDQESRGKKKKRFAFFFMAIATMVAILLPFKLKAIAVMAATALFVGKLALIIASLVGLKKLVQKQGDDTTHVHYSGHRSDADSHYLAYSEHAPLAPAAPHQQQFSPEERY